MTNNDGDSDGDSDDDDDDVCRHQPRGLTTNQRVAETQWVVD